MKRILAYLKPYTRFMTFTLTVKVFATLIELALPYILKHIIDNVIRPVADIPNPDVKAKVTEICIWAVIMIVCAGLGVLGSVWANRMAAKFARNVAEDVRSDLFRRTMTLSPAQTDHFTVPSLESRLTTDTYNIHNFINTMQRMGVRAPILLIGGLAITATLDGALTLVMIAILPFLFIAVYSLTAKGLPLYTKVQKAVDGMIRVVREDAQGIRVIKALTKQDYEYRRYDAVNKSLCDIERKTSSIMSSSNPVMNFFMNLGLVCVVFVGAYRVNGGMSEPGNIIAFIQYFTLISMAMTSITRIFVIWSKASASAVRIAEVLDTEEGLPVSSSSDYPTRAGERGIVFDKVNFAYNNTKDILHDISFELKSGQKLGIIGATGSGKTTLTALLMRFYDVSSGAIRIDGRDLRTIPEDELHSMFGVAMQHDFIVADTIKENIRFGRDISDEQIARAAKIAQAAPFIEAYEDGYDHPLDAKGANVSGGQKQRLLIARAVAGQPKILILDDSSSALDYKTDAELRKAISTELGDTTTVIVAQRVSSVMSCDLILVIDEGRIIGAGDHEKLMQTCSVYSEISKSQMGGAILE
ncbi:MAG: ABC transporter ATP-binding protein [Clostridia bacterium]|nr:ABC transporter ATP-binding protein [Clostridia bacterium]